MTTPSNIRCGPIRSFGVLAAKRGPGDHRGHVKATRAPVRASLMRDSVWRPPSFERAHAVFGPGPWVSFTASDASVRRERMPGVIGADVNVTAETCSPAGTERVTEALRSSRSGRHPTRRMTEVLSGNIPTTPGAPLEFTVRRSRC